MTLRQLPCPDCNGSGYDVEPAECCGDCAVPRQVPCRFCGGTGELSPVDDDPAVEVEMSRPPAPVPDDQQEWAEWAKSKLDPYEQAGVDPPP